MHVRGPAPAHPRRGGPLPVPQGRRRGAGRATSSSRNGARLYLDVGSHPEYATPECDDVRQLVVHDKAGERILEGLVADAQQRLPTRASPARSTSSRTTPTRPATPTAATRTTCVGRAGEFQRLSDVLIPFLVSRQIICGAGKVAHDLPRRDLLREPAGRPHLGGRVERDDPLAGRSSTPATSRTPTPSSYRRLHVIVGDSNMSETTTMLKVGVGRPRAADDRGGRGHARPHAGEPDPGDPRDQPRHDRPPARSGWPTAASCRALRDPARVPRAGRRRSSTARAWTTRCTSSVLDLWERTLTADRDRATSRWSTPRSTG